MKDFEWRYRRHRGTVAEECPRVAAMWHPTANSVSPDEVTCGSNRRIALICPKCGYGKNGEWRPSIAGACRTGGGCPACSGKVLVEGVNDVATVHPEIAAQWHPTLNKFPAHASDFRKRKACIPCLQGLRVRRKRRMASDDCFCLRVRGSTYRMSRMHQKLTEKGHESPLRQDSKETFSISCMPSNRRFVAS